jgi:hypothetical protein
LVDCVPLSTPIKRERMAGIPSQKGQDCKVDKRCSKQLDRKFRFTPLF